MEISAEQGFIYPSLIADTDILLTSSFMTYASDIQTGQINVVEINPEWEIVTKEIDYSHMLAVALEKNSIKTSLTALAPQDNDYLKLKNALNRYLEMKDKDKWKAVGFLPALAPGDTSEWVPDLRQFLIDRGYISINSPVKDSLVYDEEIKHAVIRFQQLHNIEVDGVVGPQTITEMNHTLDYRIHQIQANLERIRWQPFDYGDFFIRVNLPEYKLKLYKNGQLLTERRVIIGEEEHETPLLMDTLRYIVFNPVWRVPHSIASEELLPKIQNDTSFIRRNNYAILRNWYNEDSRVNPDSIHWKELNEDHFPYYIVQKPGHNNALGRVKFIFPNHEDIYLHDTPARYLFNRSERALSHGCVRVQDPLEFARLVFEEAGMTEKDSVYSFISKEETKKVEIEKVIPVYLTYHTAWVDENDRLNFAPDIYHTDKKIIALLEKISQMNCQNCLEKITFNTLYHKEIDELW